MEQELYSKFRKRAIRSLRWVLSGVILATLFLTFSIFAYFDVIHVLEQGRINVSLQMVFALILELAAITAFLIVLIPYALDYRLIQNGTYVTVNAIVARFDFYWSGYEPTELLSAPVLEDEDSGERLKIEVDEKVEVGERYSVAYLPRTKISVLKKQKR